MGASKAIKQLMQEQNVSVSQLASALGIQAQSMINKLYRDSFSFDEVVRIADILGSDVKLIVRESGKEFY
jgi:transcriptional regulator with XRE-family HTH domain